MSAWDRAEDHADIPWWAKALIVACWCAMIAAAVAIASALHLPTIEQRKGVVAEGPRCVCP